MTGRVQDDLAQIESMQQRGFTLNAIFEKYLKEGYTVTFSAFNKALLKARKNQKGRALEEPKPQIKTMNIQPVKTTKTGVEKPSETDYFARKNLFKP